MIEVMPATLLRVGLYLTRTPYLTSLDTTQKWVHLICLQKYKFERFARPKNHFFIFNRIMGQYKESFTVCYLRENFQGILSIKLTSVGQHLALRVQNLCCSTCAIDGVCLDISRVKLSSTLEFIRHSIFVPRDFLISKRQKSNEVTTDSKLLLYGNLT